MKRPLARAGLTPMSSRVRTADEEPDPELGVGGGEPETIGGDTRCIGGSVSTGCIPPPPAITAGDDWGVLVTATSLEVMACRLVIGAEPAGGTVAVVEPEALALRWGSLAIWLRRSRTVWGLSFGSLARTRVSSWSSSSGRLELMDTTDGIGELTVEYATSIRFAPVYGRRPVSISKVRTPIA